MMTYGWAILIIVIVAGVLYSLGIFNPSASAGNTVTGFSGFNVQAACIQGGALQMQITNGLGYTVNVTRLNTTGSNGQVISIPVSIMIPPSQSRSAFILGACTTTTGASFSNSVTLTYTEPGQTFSGPFFSSGTASGKSTIITPRVVAHFKGLASSPSYINTSKGYAAPTALTMIIWFKINSSGGTEFTSSCCNWRLLPVFGTFVLNPGNGQNQNLGITISSNKWYMAAFSAYNSGSNIIYSAYINSTAIVSGNTITGVNIAGGSAPFTFGDQSNCMNTCMFNGSLANGQIYTSALTSLQIAQLYSEGIGGAPLTNEGLIGWWPLDGNANDYSGNNNNGVAINVQWVSP